MTNTTSPGVDLLSNYSLEMTGKDVPGLLEAKDSIPAGTRINVTFLGNEDLEMRVAAAKAVRELGFTPVPHISARRLVVRRRSSRSSWPRCRRSAQPRTCSPWAGTRPTRRARTRTRCR